MDLQNLVDNIHSIAAVYAFDILPDGSFSEIRLMAINAAYAAILPSVNPNAPAFVPNTPYSLYFKDVNFEQFVYKCASTDEILYSCANAHGAWIHGMYLPIESGIPDTVYCCYVCKHTIEPDSASMSQRSTEVSSAVLNLSADLHRSQDITQSMILTAKNINQICGSETCAIFLVDTNTKRCTIITEKGSQPEFLREIADSMGRTPYEVAMAWEKDLANSDCLLLDDLSIIQERDPLWYDSMRSFHIDSIVFYAVRFNQRLVGFIWAANFDTEKMLQIKETVELTTFFIGAVIANHQLMDKLEFMSMVDMLTQVRNRNALNHRLDAFKKGEMALPAAMGIVYADLNGLKTVNDNIGHEAGDKLLQNGAELLRRAFGEYEIYRVGGDEFVILCPDITEQALSVHTAFLRQLCEQSADVRFAVGTGFFTGQYDLDEAMHYADEQMYQDKEEYYRQHPEKNRRK